MFEIGDYIVYGTNGVCKVEDISTMDSLNVSKGRIYYTLSPCYSKGSKIFIPADNEKVIMRPVITKEEALALIDEIREIEVLWIPNEKQRENEYKDAFRTCDCKQWVKIIKTIYERKMERLENGKKVTSVDEKYFHMAEESLYGELAIPLNMDKNEVREFIVEKIGVE
ncbi:MAG: CarD family transcriptional regulator [Lachnospiraceae bacterium]|jgi:CarD family transcriptional regulator|nr:CarD family transcriptional regulator [Lachnospiraceae bacterium]MDD3616978.1 CarD family transcriptional regulator [Lachnospiraceae bacterium]